MSADGDSNAGGDLVPLDHAAAKLPAAYEAARQALEACERLDECQDWASRAEAMASYARQARDESLRAMADRIQARAIRRCGELMQHIEPARGANQNIREGDHPKVTRESAAAQAGLSEHQRKQALRVANVPAEEFERAIERERPATVSELAKLGTSRNAPARDDAACAEHAHVETSGSNALVRWVIGMSEAIRRGELPQPAHYRAAAALGGSGKFLGALPPVIRYLELVRIAFCPRCAGEGCPHCSPSSRSRP